VLLELVTKLVDDNVLDADLLGLAWSGEKGAGWDAFQVEGNELLRGSVVAFGSLLAVLDAELELELDAGEELDLQLAELVLNVLGDGAFELAGAPLAHERSDLVVQVVDLAFELVHELQGVKDGHLWAELALKGADLVLAGGELGLETLLLGEGESWVLELVLELGCLRDESLLLESVLENELQVERVELGGSVA
jgi:hypothetical protein